MLSTSIDRSRSAAKRVSVTREGLDVAKADFGADHEPATVEAGKDWDLTNAPPVPAKDAIAELDALGALVRRDEEKARASAPPLAKMAKVSSPARSIVFEVLPDGRRLRR